MRLGRLLPALIAAIAISACDSGPSDAPFGVRAVELRPISAEIERPEARITPLSIPGEKGVWEVQAALGEFTKARRGKGNELRLVGKPSKRILIPGPFQAGDFNRVVLEARVFDPQGFRVQLVRDGKALLTSSSAPGPPIPGLQTIVMDLPHVRAIEGEIDALQLIVQGKGACTIQRISLVSQPLESWLPGTEGEAAQVEIGGEARLARGLTSEAPLGARLIPARDEVLCFSYGVPRWLHYPGQKPAVLLCELRGEDGEIRVERFPLDDPQNQPHWRTARIELGDFAGEGLELSFRLEAPKKHKAVCAVGEARRFVPGPPRPTVLLITSDTHRADYLGLADSGIEVRTPVLDALAERGVAFEDCFTATNITNPSHIALMTAIHPRDTGILVNNTPISRQAPTLAEAFRDAGYMTVAIVSTRHLGDDVSGLGQGFYRMSWPRNMGERDVADSVKLMEQWTRQLDDVPLFCWLHLFDAHTPYDPPESYARSYYDAPTDPFDPEAADPEGYPLEHLPDFLDGLKDPAWPEAMYRAEISHLDAELGRLFELPRIRDGIVAFTADHGENLGQHGIFYDHADLYPDTIHVPLLLSWPDGPRGERVAGPVAHIDIGRTLLDLAGLEEAPFPGRSLLEALGPDPPTAPRFAIAGNRTSASISWHGWHLILHLIEHDEKIRLRGAEKHQVELYELTTDPACLTNRLDTDFEQARLMREQLTRWLSDARDLGWAGAELLDPELTAALAKLGYTQGSGGEGAEFFDADCDCAWCERFR